MGTPGVNYWQNSSSYDLKVKLDPQTRQLTGEGQITYFNNSPDTLRYMVVKLLPNLHKKGNARDYELGADHLNEGIQIDSIAVNGRDEKIDDRKRFWLHGTNLYVIFDRSAPLLPGKNADIYICWNFEVIMNGVRNGAFTDSAFFIGYWYPQVAVYDDVYGWDREEYTGVQEAYNDLNDYRVEIEVPGDYLLWATGEQLNEKEVYSARTMQKIIQSRNSDESIHIVSKENYANEDIFKDGHSRIWKFVAKRVPDFAWACSNYYLWDANSLKLEDGKRKVWINTAYPPESETFGLIADVAHESIDYLSNVFPAIPFPFNKHITFNGIHQVAMEYPMMANNSDHKPAEMYTELTIHEIAHNYIPFLMLSNERKHAWIDEGWVKLIGELYGETQGVKREDKTELNTLRVYEALAGTSNDLPLIVPSGFMNARYNFYHSYAKASNANIFLLELMEEKGIDNPLKDFILSWEGKHPTPYDFFHFMENLYGDDLSWYWNAWYFNFNAPDLGLSLKSDPGKLMVTNHGGIPLPVEIDIEYKDGHTQHISKSMQNWAQGNSIVIDIPDPASVSNIRLGSSRIPDVDKSNNLLKM